MASQSKNSGFNRRWFLAGAAGGAMLPIAPARAAGSNKKPRGIYADPPSTPKAALEDKVADFQYENDVLAQLIVELWTGLHPDLISPATTKPEWQARSAAAKTVFKDRGIYLVQPIVITEDEYVEGFSLQDAGLEIDKGVVLVLPRDKRVTLGTGLGGPPLLETAKMLMAITPNGI
jgi:hypothetical protein